MALCCVNCYDLVFCLFGCWKLSRRIEGDFRTLCGFSWKFVNNQVDLVYVSWWICFGFERISAKTCLVKVWKLISTTCSPTYCWYMVIPSYNCGIWKPIAPQFQRDWGFLAFSLQLRCRMEWLAFKVGVVR